MKAILAITSDQRVFQTLRYCRQKYKGRFETALDFDQGLQAIFEVRPSLIFVQDELAGVSASVVARHVRGLLGTDAPSLVMLRSGPITPEAASDLFDGAVNLNLPDDELQQELIEHIEKIVLIEKASSEPPPFELPPMPAILTLEEDLELISNEQAASSFEIPPMPAILRLEDDVDLMARDQKEKTDHHPSGPSGDDDRPASLKTTLPGSIPLERKEYMGPPLTGPLDNYDWQASLKTTLPGSNQAKERSNKRLTLLVVTLLLLGAGLFFIPKIMHMFSVPRMTPTTSVNQSQPVSPSPQVVTPVQKKELALPAEIQQAELDPAFSSANPGWERRTGRGTEFRLFREDGRLAAIQVMATGSSPIEENRLQRLVAEASGAGSHTVSSHAEQDGYLIERGLDSSGSEIELYRNSKTRELRGFVLTSKQAL